MKAVVFSDSHGDTAAMREALEREAPDQILHLGDLAGDAERLGIRFPQIPLEYVCGNCDGFSLAPAVRLLELRGRRVLMMHGHTHGVKTGYGGAIAAAPAGGRGYPAVRPHTPGVCRAAGGRAMGDESR